MDTPTTAAELTAFATRLGLEFSNLALLEQALTHRSYVNENKMHDPTLQHNERLEFLGDAVIDFVTGDFLYQKFPDIREGQLTRLRSALVRTEMLAEFARLCGLDQMLRLGRGEELTGARERDSTLCNAFEALIGAIHLDQGEEAARHFIETIFEPALDMLLELDSLKDPKSQLQEWGLAQEERVLPQYHIIAEVGPEHDRLYVAEVHIKGEAMGWGTATSKRKAHHAAASMALNELASLARENQSD